MKRISRCPSYSQGVCKHKSFCGISFHFSVPCLSLYVPRAVTAYKYNQYRLMHIQLFYFKYYIFRGTRWDWEQSWRTEAAAQQICGKVELLAGKIHVFLGMKMRLWLEYQIYTINPAYWPREVPLLQHCSLMQVEVPWLSSASSGNWWEIMLLSAWNNLCIEGHSNQRCQFYPNYKQ